MTNTRIIYFGLDEAKFLEFIDSHWDRITNSGFTPHTNLAAEPFETGYYVRFAKAPVTSQKTGTSSKNNTGR